MQERDSKNSDSGGIFIGIVFILAMVVLLTVKYLPLLGIGCIIGYFISTARFQPKWTSQMKYTLLTAVFFAFWFFVLLGFPLNKKDRWAGALFLIPSFVDFCGSTMHWWNGFVSQLFFKLFKHWQVKRFTTLNVSQYIWLSYAFGFGWAPLFWIRGHWGDRALLSDFRLKIVSLPARIASLAWNGLFSGWVRLGRSNVKETGGKLLQTILIGALGGGAYFLSTQEAPLMPFSEWKLGLIYLPYGPVTGLSLGFILAFLPFGNRAIDVFFGKERKINRLDHPGFYMGKTFRGRPYWLTERNLGYHVEVIAPTGSGKTNILKLLIADRIRKGHGILFLDFKAEFESVSWMSRAARSVSRENEIRLFSLSHPELSVPYNPLKWGDASDLQSVLMNSMTWSESFYRGEASVALGTLLRSLCEYRDQTGERFHLGHLYELLDQPALMRVFSDCLASLGCKSAPKLSELASRIEKTSGRASLMGLISNLNQILFSSAGDLLSEDVNHGSFDLKEAVSQGRITVMLMNSLKLKESAQVVGKIILQDLMSFVGDHYAQIEPSTHRPITLVIDEFASFAMPTFIEFMDRARGAGIGIVLAHQARSDLKSISPEFQDRIEANSNTTLVSGVKSSSDAEYYSGMLGTRTTEKETVQKKSDLFFGESATGIKSVREVEEFVLHPNQLRDLNQGEIFAISRTIDPHWGLVNVCEAPEFSEHPISTPELTSALKSTRHAYQNQKEVRYLDLQHLANSLSKPGLARKQESAPSKSTSQLETWS